MQKKSLSIAALICLCVGPMIGSGLFALPQNLASSGGVRALIVAWIITLVGMFALTKIFQDLADENQSSNGCLYLYAKQSFGDFTGFIAAWGYWLSGWIGNIAYFLMICSTLNCFYPVFGETVNLPTLIASSSIIWGFTLLCSRGIRLSSIVNTFGTVVKVLLIFFVIVLCFYYFKKGVFVHNLIDTQTSSSLLTQIKTIMLVTAWIFVGIEGASIFSSHASKKADIGRATLFSFLIMSFVFLSISFLPFGILNCLELSNLNYPPLGQLVQKLVGNWGSNLINISLIITLIFGSLSWVMLSAEVPYLASKEDRLFPNFFQKENLVKIPIGALIITAVCEELYLLLAYFYHFDYLKTINIAVTMMLPSYFFTALHYLLKSTKKFSLIGWLGVLFNLWLCYSAGIYFVYSSPVYAIGIFLYWLHCRKNKKLFKLNRFEKLIFISIVFTSLYLLITR